MHIIGFYGQPKIIIMKNILYMTFLVLSVAAATATQALEKSYTPAPENQETRQEFADGKQGIFIHRDIYFCRFHRGFQQSGAEATKLQTALIMLPFHSIVRFSFKAIMDDCNHMQLTHNGNAKH